MGRSNDANLARDEELIDLIADSRQMVFIGMESIDPANMADKQEFRKPVVRQCLSATRFSKYLRYHFLHIWNG